MGVSETVARTMLLKMQWDYEKLQQRYFEDPEKMMGEYFVTEEQKDKSQEEKEEKFYCPVCYEETDEKICMECGHALCRECYAQHL